MLPTPPVNCLKGLFIKELQILGPPVTSPVWPPVRPPVTTCLTSPLIGWGVLLDRVGGLGLSGGGSWPIGWGVFDGCMFMHVQRRRGKLMVCRK